MGCEMFRQVYCTVSQQYRSARHAHVITLLCTAGYSFLRHGASDLPSHHTSCLYSPCVAGYQDNHHCTGELPQREPGSSAAA
jgi:hypothetical protein